ncbi:MAG: hypothetical protein GWN86_04780 [Desulfobacterales bacterium]|nr:hypothetical protein [Desulfobacterales bacterium]
MDDQKVIGTRDFTASENPPILHRKDEFLSVTDTWYPKYKRLTRQEEKAGLLGRSDIGYKKSWERLLKKKRLRIVGHRLMR